MSVKSMLVPLALLAAGVVPSAASAAVGTTVTPAERAQTKAALVAKIAVRDAKPLAIPEFKAKHGKQAARAVPLEARGQELRVPGVAAPAASKAGNVANTAAVDQNGSWGGNAAGNPAMQAGKLYFDMKPGPGEDWRHCSATAVNSPNKSLVITAGHCLFSPDPDGNGTIDGNGFWHESVMFCPGYQSGCKQGTWYARYLSTTNAWFYGTGKAKSYDFADDVAAVVVAQDATRGLLVNNVGGQGIVFNLGVGLQRHAFGYPMNDSRWPDYTYDGETLIYCGGTDTYDGYGHLEIGCTMTGGASGGPWLVNPGLDWLGYVNSVNSHKVNGGPYMSGPYFGNSESNLYRFVASR